MLLVHQSHSARMPQRSVQLPSALLHEQKCPPSREPSQKAFVPRHLLTVRNYFHVCCAHRTLSILHLRYRQLVMPHRLLVNSQPICCLISPCPPLLLMLPCSKYHVVVVGLGYLKTGLFRAGGCNLFSIKLIELMRSILSLESVRFS